MSGLAQLDSRGRTKAHRIFLAIRRPVAGEPHQWWPVRGLAMHLPDWPSLDIFTYRDGKLVFVTDANTGIALAAAPSVPLCRDAITSKLMLHGVERIRAALKEDFKLLNPGPKPKFELIPNEMAL